MNQSSVTLPDEQPRTACQSQHTADMRHAILAPALLSQVLAGYRNTMRFNNVKARTTTRQRKSPHNQPKLAGVALA